MMYMSDDPARDAERYTEDLYAKLMKYPVCDCCGKHIRECFALHYKNFWLCESCRYDNEEYIEVDE